MSVSIGEFGAVGDGIQDDTEAFEKGIAWIQQNGGGQLIVTGSQQGQVVYRIRPINLTSHMELYIESGAMILGIANASLWPVIPPLPSYGQGRDHPGPRHTSLLHGENLVNVTIRGQDPFKSIVDGNGAYWYQLHDSGNETITRGHLVEFMYTRGFRMYSLLLQNSPFWTVHPYDCDNVHIQNVHVVNANHTPNTDGFDPDSSRNVLIEDCTYTGGDDCVSIKSGWDCFGVEYGKPASNIHIRNLTCMVNRISVGSEMSGGIENVLGEQIYFPSLAWEVVKFKSGESRGGYMRNITFRDIKVTGLLKSSALKIAMNLYSGTDGRNPSCPASWTPPVAPEFKDFVFENWDGMESTFIAQNSYDLEGLNPASPIQNVLLKNLYFPDPISPDAGIAISSWICTDLVNVSVVYDTVTPGPPVGVVNGTVVPSPPCKMLQIDTSSKDEAEAAPFLFSKGLPQLAQWRKLVDSQDSQQVREELLDWRPFFAISVAFLKSVQSSIKVDSQARSLAFLLPILLLARASRRRHHSTGLGE